MSTSMSAGNAKTKSLKLKSIQTKYAWGGRPLGPYTSNLLAVHDHEFILATGTGFLYVENASVHTRKSYLVEPHSPDIIKISCATVAKEGRYCAMAARMKNDDRATITVFVYSTTNHMQDNFKPHEIKYTCPLAIDPSDRLEVTAISFTADCSLIGVLTNMPPVGVVIFDHFKGGVFQTIATDTVPISMSFNPMDPFKICVTGESNFVKLWRFTGKSVIAAPVSGLRRGYFSYTAHSWVPPYVESAVVVGSDGGFLSAIQNCEQRTPALQAFGTIDHFDAASNAVKHILVRGDIVVVGSASNMIAVYEVRRTLASKGVVGLNVTLIPLAKYRLEGATNLYGLQFCVRESNTSYTLMAATSSALTFLDMITDFDLSSGGAALKPPRPSSSTAGARQALTEDGDEDAEDADGEYWKPVKLDKNLFQFHSSGINCLSVAAQGCTFVTFSYDEATLRFWDYAEPNTFTSAWMTEDFKERLDDNPFHVDLHPNGLHVVCASETEVKEFAIWDTQMDLIRRIPVRVPFKGTGGAPIVITQPVSLVRYSNGGHLLAVVTGKIVQIFHMFLKEEQQTTTFGSPYRVMTLTDHVAPITDLAFLRDDSGLVSGSNDGCVYSWVMGAKARDKEFVKKGFAVTHLAVSKTQGERTIVASFESVVSGGESSVPLANDVVRRRRQSSIAVRKSSMGMSTRGSRGDISRGSRESRNPRESRGGSADFSGALAAFSAAEQQSPPRSPATPGTSKHFVESSSGTPAVPSSQMQYRAGTGAGGGGGGGGAASKQCFLALWETDMTKSPTIIHMPAVVRAIQLGKSSGPDSFELCVIGLADGQIILSMLPLPLISLHESPPPTLKVNFSTSYAVENKRMSVSLRGGATKRSGLLSSVGEDEDSRGGGGRNMTPFGASTVVTDVGADDASQSTGIASEEGFRSRLNSTVAMASIASSQLPGSVSAEHSPSKPAGTGSTSEDALAPPSTANAYSDHVSTYQLNLAQCRTVRLVVGGTSQIAFSPDGAWLIITGEDGSVFMLSTTRKFAEHAALGHPSVANAGSGATPINAVSVEAQQRDELSKMQFLMVERTKMEGIRAKLIEMETSSEQAKKDHELYVGKILEGREKLLRDLESKMKREVQARDETILQARRDYLALKRSSASEIEALKKNCDESLSGLELLYERRLAQESVYLDKMKQAYDEYVVNMKMDMTAIQDQVDVKMRVVELEKVKVVAEAEKQKLAILNYYEYIKRRNEEVIASLEDQQAEEQSKLKLQVGQTNAMLAEAQAKNMSAEVQASHMIQKLKVEIEHKEVEVMRVNSDLEWANDRIARLEAALQQATSELKARAELAEKWDVKSGEMGKRIDDLEKVRKTLTNQLHALREELLPKEDQLHKAAEKLQEIDREYEVSLHAITEKEKALNHKTQNLLALQKQVRDLRKQCAQKDVALKRSAVLLEDFVYAMHEERFMPKSRTFTAVGDGLATGSATAVGKDAVAATTPSAQGGGGGGAADLKTRTSSVIASTPGIASALAIVTTQTGQGSGPVGASGGGGDALEREEGGKAGRPSALSTPHSHDLIAALKLEMGVNTTLRRLHDVLRPYIKEGDVDTEIIDDVEQVRREQDRHMTLLHRNFSSLQSSLETAQQVLSYKVQHHLTDNQTLLKEVNQLRSEVKSLSLENQRLAAQLDFAGARRQEQINAFNAQFLSLEDTHVPEVTAPSKTTATPGTAASSGSAATAALHRRVDTPPSVQFPSLSPAPYEPSTGGGKSRAAAAATTSAAGGALMRKAALVGSYSQPLLPSASSVDSSGGQRAGVAGKSKTKQLKSIEQLLGSSLEAISVSTPPAAAGSVSSAASGKRTMSADEKVAKIVELNLAEIKASRR